MIRKGKLVKNTAIALAIISVFGNTLSTVSAAEIMKSSTAIEQYVEGTYDISAKLIKDNSDEDSMANGYLKETKIEISKNKMYMVMTFENGKLLKELKPSVNGKEVEGKITTSSDDKKTVKFEIGSLTDKIELNVLINPFGNFKVEAACRVKVEKAQIPTKPEEKDDAVTSPTPSVPDKGDSDKNDKEEVTGKEETLNTTLKHATEDKDSSAQKFLKSSKLKTVDGKKYMVMTFTNGNMFTAMKGIVNDKEVETKFNFDKESDTVTVEFEISSLKDKVSLSFSYNTPMGAMTHSARVESSLASSEDKKEDVVVPPTTDKEDKKEDVVVPPTTDKEDKNDEVKPPANNNNAGTNNGSGSNTNKNGFYQLKNTVKCDNAVGYQMVRITKNVIDNDTVELTVEVPNLDAQITMGMFVKAMNQTVSFGVAFDKTSVKFISSNEEPTIPDSNNGSSNNGNLNTGGNNNSNSGNSNETITENTTVKGKLYTVKNEVLSDNATGKSMARKYLNSTTKIEEVDGKMYATLTFTGVDLMNNHKIYVNGSLVNHTITSKTSSSVSIRFAIQDVNADIKVQVHVVPMNSTVTFGVKLLKDTLTFVKDFTVENGSLPQTGSAFGSEMLLGFGGLLTASGALLRRKRK